SVAVGVRQVESTLSGGCDKRWRGRFEGCEELARVIPLRYGAAAASPVAMATTRPCCQGDRSDAAGGARPPVAPAEGSGPPSPRVGAVPASPPRPEPVPGGYHDHSWIRPTRAGRRHRPSDPRPPDPPRSRRPPPRRGRA